MQYFNQEQLEKLKSIETYLKTSLYYSYKRGTSKDENQILIDVWKEFNGEELKNFSCGTCCLNNYKTVAKVYYDSIQYWNEQSKITETKTDVQCQQEEHSEVVKKKRQRTVKS